MKTFRVLCSFLVLLTSIRAYADTAWSEQKVTASDGTSNTYFGTAAAVSGSFALIGAYGDSNHRGAAYIETKTGSIWTEGQKITADDSLAGDEYVFAYDGTSWTQRQKLIADDGDTVDNFGVSAAIGLDTIFIGSPYAAVNGHANQGAVYVFQSSAGGWTQVDKLTASDGAANDSFGMSMSLDGSTLVIGATGTDGHGAAYVFQGFNGTFWKETQKLVADDAGPGDNFGDAIGVSGSEVLIAADVATVDGNTSRGAGYLFVTPDGLTWTQSHKFVASDGTTDDFLGAAAAYDGETAILSSPHPVINGHAWQGAAYFYARDTLFADGFDG